MYRLRPARQTGYQGTDFVKGWTEAVEHLLALPKNSTLSKRDQICEAVGRAISKGAFGEGQSLPSCRALAAQLGVSRNTVFQAYCRMVDIGLLRSRDRSGFQVAVRGDGTELNRVTEGAAPQGAYDLPDIETVTFNEKNQVIHPKDWASYAYPFIYNQIDPTLFPLDDWRECTRLALSRRTIDTWTRDAEGLDNRHLIQQLRERMLSYRGVLAAEDEILITLGAQNALSIIGMMFAPDSRRIGIENPGFHEARNVFELTGNRLYPIPVDAFGLQPQAIAADTKLVFTTPRRHFPTMVTMTPERRTELLSRARRNGLFIVEDDYELELAGMTTGQASLKSQDTSGNVIFVGSLSKTLTAGMRLGFIVADRRIIAKAREIRRLLLRQPPSVVQETVALFIAIGYHDAHLKRIKRRYTNRRETMGRAIAEHLPFFETPRVDGGTSFWLTGPPGFDASAFCERLQEASVLADKGVSFYFDNEDNRSFRLGFAYLPVSSIEDGIRVIAREYRAFTA